jgi:hypothetical protein
MSVQDFKQIRATVLTTAHDMDPNGYATPSDLLADFAAQVGECSPNYRRRSMRDFSTRPAQSTPDSRVWEPPR